MKKFIVAAVFALVWPTSASAHSHLEENVSAEILYNLVRFSKWEANRVTPSNGKYDICVCGDDDRVTALSYLHGRISGKDSVYVHVLQSREEIKTKCRTLYLSSGNYSSLDLPHLATLGVLTVGDELAFLNAGGQVIIARDGNKLTFGINREMMRAARIKPSSKILRLAKDEWSNFEIAPKTTDYMVKAHP